MTATDEAQTAIADEIIEDRWAVGLSVAIRRGAVVTEIARGLADLETCAPVKPDTEFRIGSATKIFTSATVLGLVERGVIGLDERLGEHLPEVALPVTIRQLLDHTAGLHEYTTDPDFSRFAAAGLTVGRMVERIASWPLEHEPGLRWSYTNSGYVLLGALVERITGSYATAVGSLATGVRLGADVPAAADARGYRSSTEGFVPSPPIQILGAYSAGGLCARARDLADFATRLFEGEVLAPALLREMTTPTVVAGGTAIPYGLGVQIEALDGYRRYGHGGRISGFSSSLAYYPEPALTVVVLANTELAGAVDIGDQIARVVLGTVPPPVEEWPLSAEEGDRLEGRYDIETFGRIFVERIGGRIRLTIGEHRAIVFRRLLGGELVEGRWHQDRLRGDGDRIELVVEGKTFAGARVRDAP